MKQYNIFLFYILIAFSLMACPAMEPIDTYNKKVAAFEITYNETLKTAKLYLNSVSVPESKKDSIRAAISSTAQARAAMQVAQSLGDISEAQTQLQVAQKALTVLRELAAEGKL